MVDLGLAFEVRFFIAPPQYNQVRRLAMTIQLPQELEAALKAQASVRGLTAEDYLRELIQRELASALHAEKPPRPFKTGYGMLAKYGPAPSAEEIDENRRDMFKNFGEKF
jgi:hypothetical protein